MEGAAGGKIKVFVLAYMILCVLCVMNAPQAEKMSFLHFISCVLCVLRAQQA